MSGILHLHVPFRNALTDQPVWLHNVNKRPIFIDWGDDTAVQVTGDTNNEYISHTYTSPGSYTVYAYYDGVWGDDQGNAIEAVIPGDDKNILVEAEETLLTGLFTILDSYPVYSANAINNEFLSLSLPYSDITIGSNEFAVADNINAVFNKIQQNTAYLTDQTIVLDPTIKNLYIGWLAGGVAGNNLWHSDLPGLDTYLYSLTATSSFTNLVDIKVTTDYIYLLSSTSLSILDARSINATLVTQATATGFNEVFTNLQAFDVSDSGDIYVLQQGTIYRLQYDTINNKITRITQIGGFGFIDSKYLFNNAKDIAVDNQGRVFVVDSDNLCVKVYAGNMSWLKTIQSAALTPANKPINICTNKQTGQIYVLTSGKQLLIINPSLEISSEVSINQSNSTALQNILANDTIYKIFTDIPDNFLYVVTNTSTIKLSKNGRLISKMDLPAANLFNNLRSGCIDPNDQIYVTKTDRVFKLLDPINSISLSRSTPWYPSMSAVAINTREHEFVQDWVYNKAIHRILQDLVVLSGSLQQKTVISFDLDGSLRSFYVRPLESSEKRRMDINLNNFIGVNEFVLSDVINRVLRNITQIQSDILDTIKPSVIFIPSTTDYPVLP